ncbi:MAG: tRNA (N(6)-L-threonylcarbamoyladenosine(37)-C(2))-methylthiotransferase [Thermoproteota archaeon]|nr:tRNA (N(6)-L-threonylcarbamoyladenosine(37)-C(2))-methylthiotransferase [Thermoproteota archaeon]
MKVFIRSFGCSANLADGEVLGGCLAEAGFELVKKMERAEVVVVNTCAVKGPTENRVIYFLKKVPREKRLIVAGCLPLINFKRLNREVEFDGVAGPACGRKIVNIVQRVMKGEKVLELKGATKVKPDLTLPKVKVNPVVGIIPVSYGCLGSCAYCCVRFARGHLRSYSVNEILNQISRDVAAGVHEVWLTSQDMGCYGLDGRSNLVELLEAVCNLNGNFWVRVGMMNPRFVLLLLDNLVEVFTQRGVEAQTKKDPSVSEPRKGELFWFLHLPVQSGDDEVLKRMNRRYKAEDFRRIVREFRKSCPEITVWTDIIVGFPGETDKAFENSMRLIEEVQPDVVNISKFFTRPHTAAKKMNNQIPSKVIKERSGKISRLARQIALEKNRRWIGWEGQVLIDEKGKTPESFMGRNLSYKPVVVHSRENLLGRFLRVRVVDAFLTHLEAEIVN